MSSEPNDLEPGQATSGGALILVATPIGNLADISIRAAEVLKSSPVIGCEDTRRTGRLLEYLGVDRSDGEPRLLVVNEASEEAVIAEVLDLLSQNVDVALVCDAGTPGVADPGTELVAAVAAAGHRTTIVPGASAPLAALAISGVAVLPHVMEGWLPRRGEARAERLAQIAAEHRTVVILESPKRVAATLAELSQVCEPQRTCVVVRELTKFHEEVVRSTLAEMAESFASAHEETSPRGEFVVVLGPLEAATVSRDEIVACLQERLDAGLKVRTAVDQVTEQLGVTRKRVYGLALELSGN